MAFIYPEISDYARAKLMQRAEGLLVAQQALMEQGGAHALMLKHSGHLGEQGENLSDVQGGFIADWHYPKGDRIDFDGGGQYFYHCHRENMQTQEHGHFHCFIRRAGWPKSWPLARIPERAKYADNPMTHIVAIGINRYGLPIRLFMVNRWVSKESWFAADKMQRIAKRFDLSAVKAERPKTGDQAEQWRLMDQWVENIVHVFAPQIQWLYEQRDAEMARLVAACDAKHNPYLDEEIEELASVDIALEKQVEWLMSEL
jgi:hypothetical protein